MTGNTADRVVARSAKRVSGCVMHGCLVPAANRLSHAALAREFHARSNFNGTAPGACAQLSGLAYLQLQAICHNHYSRILRANTTLDKTLNIDRNVHTYIHTWALCWYGTIANDKYVIDMNRSFIKIRHGTLHLCNNIYTVTVRR